VTKRRSTPMAPELYAIRPEIPGAGLLILPNTSHFAFLQDPALFNAALLHFLGDR
jgi:pimeloyl-ACP methyl ester carboxylesterase